MSGEKITVQLQKRIEAELVSDETGALAGPLGEAIALVGGNYSLEFVTPEHVAQGFCRWLGRSGGVDAICCTCKGHQTVPDPENPVVGVACPDCLAPTQPVSLPEGPGGGSESDCESCGYARPDCEWVGGDEGGYVCGSCRTNGRELGELLNAVEPFTVDGGVGCGTEEVDALVETYEQIIGGVDPTQAPVKVEGFRFDQAVALLRDLTASEARNALSKALRAATPYLQQPQPIEAEEAAEDKKTLGEIEAERDWAKQNAREAEWRQENSARAWAGQIGEVRAEREEMRKALALVALAWPYGDDLLTDGLYADPFEAEGLLETGRDQTGEGYCHLSKAGIELANRVLADRFTPASTQPIGVEPSDRERLIELADLIGGVHADGQLIDSRLREDDARFLRSLAEKSEPPIGVEEGLREKGEAEVLAERLRNPETFRHAAYAAFKDRHPDRAWPAPDSIERLSLEGNIAAAIDGALIAAGFPPAPTQQQEGKG